MTIFKAPKCSWRGTHGGRRKGTALIIATACVIALSWSSKRFTEHTKHNRLLGPLSADDPYVINEVKLRYLHEATGSSPEQIIRHRRTHPRIGYYSFDFYKKAMDELFLQNRVTGGYFVEAGALDGIYLSNTLPVETELGWDGLLIEPDKAMFNLLLATQRKTRSINCCISPHHYPYKALMRALSPPVRDEEYTIEFKSMSTLFNDHTNDDRVDEGFPSYYEVQCFPIKSLLLAADVTNITLFSLDVEDVEWEILKTFPFETVNVDVWFVEHRKFDENGIRSLGYDSEFVSWFEEQNYRLYDYSEHNVADYVFVKTTSNFSKVKSSTFKKPQR